MDIQQIRNKISKIKEFADGLNETLAEIEKIEKKVTEDNFTALEEKAKDIDKKLKTIEKLIDNPPENFSMIADLNTWIEVKKQDIKQQKKVNRFASELNHSLQEINLKLDGNIREGLKVGFLKLKLDIRRDQITIIYGTDKEILAECPIRVGVVKSYIEKYLIQEKLASNIPVEELFTHIKEAYERARKYTSTHEGVPINLLLPELAILIQDQKFKENPLQENYKSYTRANYSYDLHRLREAGYLQQDLVLHIASKEYTKEQKDFLWIPKSSNGLDGGNYSHLIIKNIS
jgi:hypothetical protein